MIADADNFELNESNLRIRASSVSWDSNAFKFRVASISDIRVGDVSEASKLFERFKCWVDNNSFEMVTCRMAYPSMSESILLEKNGYFFIELLLHPTITNLQRYSTFTAGAHVELVEKLELPLIASMANRAFSHERYHLDPRVSTERANQRYSNWIHQSFESNVQSLYKVVLGEKIIAFFIVEDLDKRVAYWHLTAVNPDFLNRGYGYIAWNAVIEFHKLAGFDEVRTSIAASNIAVLNLYSKLNFRFNPPEITFHWKR